MLDVCLEISGSFVGCPYSVLHQLARSAETPKTDGSFFRGILGKIHECPSKLCSLGK